MKTASRLKRTIVAVLLATTVLSGGGGYLAARAFAADAPITVAPAEQPAPVAARASFADLVEKVKPAVVNISTTEKVESRQRQQQMQSGSLEDFFRQFMEQQGQRKRGPQHALGSGFIIDPSGYIVTNNHVVEDAAKVVVTLDDGSEHPAVVKGRDPKTDVALLKIESKAPLPYVAFGDSDKARIGDWVVAVGNPFGLGGSVSAGILSARGRNLNNGPYDNFLQIDAPINPGNSGGPIFDATGRVIGISTAIYSPSGGSVGIGFGVPSNLASTIAAQLKDGGKVERGWLGVSMQPMTEGLAKAVGRKSADGVLVAEVMPDAPAARAGLKQGDVVTTVNGQAVRDPRDLATQVAGLKAGDTTKLGVWRDGREKTISVTIGSQPSDQTAALNDTANEEGKVGLSLAPLTPELRNRLGLENSAKGAVVAEVASDSKAEESGVQPGDIIVGVAGKSVASPSQAVDAIKAAQHEKKEAVTLLVMRNGTTYYLALQLA
ncbi:MAG: DegQ family serine endoprotease [Ferrovibrio sp.]|uniref:DegQ family serine endoprotease n=1 Tax=Ferrovibrio sp. TaxID=1917215 RepID=UPI002621C0F9|nr:DegQ family serine endoprotease [Ferrovibrio sp.]MCW0231975.1 DegQ family serine endoprotease [Ferrovibrio sp.]